MTLWKPSVRKASRFRGVGLPVGICGPKRDSPGEEERQSSKPYTMQFTAAGLSGVAEVV